MNCVERLKKCRTNRSSQTQSLAQSRIYTIFVTVSLVLLSSIFSCFNFPKLILAAPPNLTSDKFLANCSAKKRRILSWVQPNATKIQHIYQALLPPPTSPPSWFYNVDKQQIIETWANKLAGLKSRKITLYCETRFAPLRPPVN